MDIFVFFQKRLALSRGSFIKKFKYFFISIFFNINVNILQKTLIYDLIIIGFYYAHTGSLVTIRIVFYTMYVSMKAIREFDISFFYTNRNRENLSSVEINSFIWCNNNV